MPDRARRSLARMPIQMRTMPSDPLAIAPASPCIYAAAAATSGTKAGSSDSMSSCCASNAPNTPANTSPEPAVAIQAGARPDRMIRVFPSPSAPTTMVTAPLSSTVAPVSSCARNAARNGELLVSKLLCCRNGTAHENIHHRVLEGSAEIRHTDRLSLHLRLVDIV